ncbi:MULTISPECIES: ImmA/IrrE family metallo-endopeptidase [Clostridia]|uniref:ImmA/IrrE family metallo-endopeptidase n=1 Tax=Clostridia TaxID=186801 RepID=UPI00257081CF|nr:MULTISPECIES: ImmA/IrrE family metallo-endopeptidase [Clostridia]
MKVEANTFAVELLLPDECLYEYVSTNITIKEVAATYGIPEQICHLKISLGGYLELKLFKWN